MSRTIMCYEYSDVADVDHSSEDECMFIINVDSVNPDLPIQLESTIPPDQITITLNIKEELDPIFWSQQETMFRLHDGSMFVLTYEDALRIKKDHVENWNQY